TPAALLLRHLGAQPRNEPSNACSHPRKRIVGDDPERIQPPEAHRRLRGNGPHAGRRRQPRSSRVQAAPSLLSTLTWRVSLLHWPLVRLIPHTPGCGDTTRLFQGARSVLAWIQPVSTWDIWS